jgi:hypothetical protein
LSKTTFEKESQTSADRCHKIKSCGLAVAKGRAGRGDLLDQSNSPCPKPPTSDASKKPPPGIEPRTFSLQDRRAHAAPTKGILSNIIIRQRANNLNASCHRGTKQISRNPEAYVARTRACGYRNLRSRRVRVACASRVRRARVACASRARPLPR